MAMPLCVGFRLALVLLEGGAQLVGIGGLGLGHLDLHRKAVAVEAQQRVVGLVR
jgi:hypothetical protein